MATAKKRSGGPKKGSMNAIKNGTSLKRLVVGQLPAKMVRVQRYARQYRRELEEAVASAHGAVDLTQAHLIDAAASHEAHAAICRWLLREKLPTMSVSDIRECSKQIATAKDARNKAVIGLDLNPPEQTIDLQAYLATEGASGR